ncbi:NADH-quinone oxidoreductase subunit M [[Limnothrix rosea] IAM M-220]|uniref:NADH-quinone oxidoreductase subunit M n=1 Tax=[Limnothrix rosea] IAM M-220 TaxID=454133 RepID=UPI000965D4BA|nr:NADH-quinone oxidoreductase subunit M [[Limnothrix rosea] IAM M-220]OKH16913.1 NAD(P)H-quinone oxidoreductase subunit D4 [[Limnothrix rosea] IAM M-220]
MLSTLIWLPLLGALIVAIVPQTENSLLSRRIALAIAAVVFSWNIWVVLNYDVAIAGLQFTEHITWVEWLGLNYDIAIDGLSLPLIALNSLLTLVALWISDKNIHRSRFYYALFLFLQASVNGAFLAQDVLLFFFFYELEIIPLYFMIAIWGGQRRGYAAIKFLLYTAVSGILLLAAFLGLTFLSNSNTFAYAALQNNMLPMGTQLILLGAIIIGFGIKIPFFPFHTWLPDAHVEASTPVSVILAGVLLKLGTYGLLKFGIGLFPDAWAVCAPWLAIWASVSALYGASCAIAQKDMKKVVAYSSIAHMAFILLAAAAATPLSLAAAEIQMISHGLISGLLFLLVGIVYKKTNSRDVDYLRGLLNPERGLPLTGSLMILGVMASAGLPGMAGFVAEFLIFRGSLAVYPMPTLLCLVGTGLTAVYFLLMINKVFFGRLTPELAEMAPVSWADQFPAVILVLLLFVFGLQPQWMIRWSEADTAALVTPAIATEISLK